MEGTIIKGVGGLYCVKVDEKIINCKVRGKFRFKEKTPMVGDRVTISLEENKDDEGVIEEIHERVSELIRPVVANVTQAFVFFTLKSPDLNLDLLFKFLVLCEYNHLRSIICFNKMDLVKDEDKEVMDMLENIGYEVIKITAKEGKGIEELKNKIRDNISVFCGPSGVGKSTTLNAMVGRELMETGDISKKLQRGKHTTRHSELIEYEGGYLVDTPGFSSLDINFIDKLELKKCFPEFEKYEDLCKFNDCMHNKEPKCAVKEAVDKKEINEQRYEFYIKTLEELLSGRNKKW